MKKLPLISTVVLLMFAALAPASAAPNGPPHGFILQDTDAAYAAFHAGSDCSVFVGYVRTDRLKLLGLPGGFQSHSDLEVKLTGSCVPSGSTLEGVVDTLNRSDAVFEELVSASIEDIAVDLYLIEEATGVMSSWGVARVDLEWTARGEAVEWKVNSPGDHSSHESKLVSVEGTVMITEGATPWDNLTEEDVIDDEDWFTETGLLLGPIITLYDEVNLRPWAQRGQGGLVGSRARGVPSARGGYRSRRPLRDSS